MDLNVKGKAAWVVGGGEGIGELVALLLADEGADIAVCDIDGAKAESVGEKVRSKGVRALASKLDVRDGEQVKRRWGLLCRVLELCIAYYDLIDFLPYI